MSLLQIAAGLFLLGAWCAAAAVTPAGKRHGGVLRGSIWGAWACAGLVSAAAVAAAVIHLVTGVLGGSGVGENVMVAFFGLLFVWSAVALLGLFGMWAAIRGRLTGCCVRR